MGQDEGPTAPFGILLALPPLMRALSWNDILAQMPERRRSIETAWLHLVPDPPPQRLRIALFALTMVACVAAGLLAFSLFARSTFDVGPAIVSIEARPAVKGTTTLSLPPFGAVAAATHSAPLNVTASLEEVDITRLQGLALNGVPGTRTIEAFKGQAVRGAEQAVGKGLMAALVASAFLGWALRRDWQGTLVGGMLGLAIPALVVTSAVLGFQANAFRNPRYTGTMRFAPSIIGLVQGRLERVGNLQKQVEDAVKQMNAYYSNPQTFSAGGAMPNTFRVLQVSDLHLDPVGFKLESELASVFRASVVLDVGDADDYGTPIEGSVIQRFLDTRVPRIFVPGNHESPSVVRAIASMPNVTVLSSGTVTIDGLTVYGLADTMSRQDGWKPDNQAMLIEAQQAANDLRAAQAATPYRRPQIVATHNPIGLEPFAGLAPLLVAGHTHTMDLRMMGPSWYVNSGTVGGVDFAKLYTDPSIPHGASILYFTEALPRRLVAIDQISVWGRVDQSSLKRTVVDPALLDELIKQSGSKASTATAVPKQH